MYSLVNIFLVADVLENVARSRHAVSVTVGDLETEFVFERHDNFNVVESVESEVVDEVRLHRQLLGIDLVVEAGHKDDTFLQGFECKWGLEQTYIRFYHNGRVIWLQN
ncbi:hypothetical protein L596_005542 [Steinernema carpocapsae]|uniref:Uncharacterized protein n=1 Tax=Steinernema carpocapsae TaxID=34508 RepID=A0A4U8UZB7_STECR|nr:hypothetical protein L596_005542 [Steinernema carpocapsae]